MKNQDKAKLDYLLICVLLLAGCANHLSVIVLDDESSISVEDITVEAMPDDGKSNAQSVQTRADGVAEFKEIDRAPVMIVIPGSDDYFPDTTMLKAGNNIKNVEIRLESLTTILYGTVKDDMGIGIPNCMIKTFSSSFITISNS